MEPQPLPHTSTTPTPRSSAPNLVRALTWTFVSLFLILTVIIAIAWYVLDPHEPRFRLRGRYEVELNITNPNKKVQVMVESFNVLVCYGKVGLSRTDVLQPIYLEEMRDKDVKVKLRLKDSPTELAHKAQDLVNDWNRGIVNFDVKMVARIKFIAGIWPTREKFLDICCGNLDVGFVPIKDIGKLLGIGKDCHARS
ncbi:Late embryogenesis abundant protein [Sesbania bispinosa]|nr:Late embryogenesis abundant protein [Sesbania bispinosa]